VKSRNTRASFTLRCAA